MMQELRGMTVVNALTEKYKKEVANLSAHGITPKLAIVRVGQRAADLSYERGVIKRFSSVGAAVQVVNLLMDCTQEKLEEIIMGLNSDESTHGILVFRPLPTHLSEEKIKNLISEAKDVDCMSPANFAHVFAGDRCGYPPCTPQAVIELLDHYGIDVAGKKVTVVGRSLVVGKPLSMLLLHKNATVTICHSKTKNLEAECKSADILIAAVGVAKMINEGFVSPNQIVIDIGINQVGDKLCGDVDYVNVAPIVQAITPVPCGVGVVTTSVLLKHTIHSAAGRIAKIG